MTGHFQGALEEAGSWVGSLPWGHEGHKGIQKSGGRAKVGLVTSAVCLCAPQHSAISVPF